MQLPLSFAQGPSNQVEPIPNVWSLLSNEQRSEAMAVLARLLAKAAAPTPVGDSTPLEEEKRDD
jgi:hypothetical protein